MGIAFHPASVFRRNPGAPGPIRTLTAGLAAFFWGTNTRRTITTVSIVCLFLAAYYLKGPASSTRLTQLAVLSAVFTVIVLRPHIGVLALVAYRILSGGLGIESIAGSIGTTVVKSLGLLTLVGFVGLIVVKKIRPVYGDKSLAILLMAFMLSLLLSSFAALVWSSVSIVLFRILQNVILFFIFVNLYSDERWLARYLVVMVVCVVIACLTGLLSIPFGGEIRIMGTTGNANGLALIANQGVAVLLVLVLFDAGTRNRFLYMAGLAVCVAATIFTGSRGGMLALLITFAYQLMKRRRALVPYLVGLIIVAGLFALIPQTYKERQSRWFESILSGQTEAATGGSRGFIYRSALDIWKRSPIIGIGPRTFGIIYQSEYGYKAKGAAARAGAVHSGFLEILVENGILGFLVFLGLIVAAFTLFKSTGRLASRPGMTRILLLNDAYEASFLALIVSGAFETIVKNNGFFIGAAAATCLNRIAFARARRLENELQRPLAAPGPRAADT